MQVTIQVSDQKSLGTDLGSSALSISKTDTSLLNISSLAAIDGGAPEISGEENDSAIAGGMDQIDIGGPPQWLVEGLDRNKASAGNISAHNPGSAV
jgi:hypothetical protein